MLSLGTSHAQSPTATRDYNYMTPIGKNVLILIVLWIKLSKLNTPVFVANLFFKHCSEKFGLMWGIREHYGDFATNFSPYGVGNVGA